MPYTGVIDRPDLQDILLKNLKEGTVINSMDVTGYVENKGLLNTFYYHCTIFLDGTVDLIMSDGSEVKGFDILVGADGIWFIIVNYI